VKRFVSIAALAVMIGASLLARFPSPTPLRSDARRAELQRFVERVGEQTPPRSTILFILPASEDDGGLTNHRLRYLLPGRFVRTNLDRGTAPETHTPDFVARWPQQTLEKVR
jgi:hypothetical protein